MNAQALAPDGDARSAALARVAEHAVLVRGRSQFFVWSRGSMQVLLPHELMACGAWDGDCASLQFSVFNSVSLAPAALQALADGRGPVLAPLLARWTEGGGRPLALPVGTLLADGDTAALLRQAGVAVLLAHGLARPQRLHEIETFFVFGLRSAPAADDAGPWLERLLPQLHVTWRRVVADEPRTLQPAGDAGPRLTLTRRELEILQGLRDGLSNRAIGVRLGLSPLTVKNHVQNVLRKLEAGNRAQAVAQAIAGGLLAPAARRPPPASNIS